MSSLTTAIGQLTIEDKKIKKNYFIRTGSLDHYFYTNPEEEGFSEIQKLPAERCSFGKEENNPAFQGQGWNLGTTGQEIYRQAVAARQQPPDKDARKVDSVEAVQTPEDPRHHSGSVNQREASSQLLQSEIHDYESD